MLQTWQISSANGNQATILNFGARLIDWCTQISRGQNVIVGYDHIEDYLQDGACMGAIAGPYANRIAQSQVIIDGQTIYLGANEGENHLHGGKDGLQNVYWQLKEQTKDKLTLTYLHQKRAAEGYPGPIHFEVSYQVTENNELRIEFSATSASKVPVGPTGHAYFNLAEHNKNINSHWLTLNAATYTPVAADNIPTGDIATVPADFDFTSPKQITTSLDHNFVVSRTDDNVPVARLSSKESGVALEVYSDYPGVQVYTADHMGSPFVPRNGICIEPQYYPDAPNKPDFPFEFTTPEKPFRKKIRYRMLVNE